MRYTDVLVVLTLPEYFENRFLDRSRALRVLTLVAYAWAGFGAGFGLAVILSLLWPRKTRNGVLARMATGAVTVAAWANLEGGIFDVYEILPGFLAGFAAIVVVSLLGREPPPEVQETFSRT